MFLEISQGFSDPIYLLTSGHVIEHFGNVLIVFLKGFHWILKTTLFKKFFMYGSLNATCLSKVLFMCLFSQSCRDVSCRVVSCRATCAACYMQTEFTDLTIKNTH